ncbi:MAG: hypothetical protein ACKV2V_18575 [Blastocatellia bacterium]
MSRQLNGADLTDSLKRFFRNLKLSPLELVCLVAALAFAGVVAFTYLTKIAPKQYEISDLNAKMRKHQAEIDEAKQKADALKRQSQHKQEIIASFDEFEDHLRDRGAGTTGMIAEINKLSVANHLTVDAYDYVPRGADVVPVETPPPAVDGDAAARPAPTPRRIKQARDLNIFPALGIDTTVEGEYRNLRKFIYELERSRQFLLIHSISFQGVDEKARSLKREIKPSQIGNLPDATVRSIALKIELEAYFRKPSGQRAFMYPAVNNGESATRKSGKEKQKDAKEGEKGADEATPGKAKS